MSSFLRLKLLFKLYSFILSNFWLAFNFFLSSIICFSVLIRLQSYFFLFNSSVYLYRRTSFYIIKILFKRRASFIFYDYASIKFVCFPMFLFNCSMFIILFFVALAFYFVALFFYYYSFINSSNTLFSKNISSSYFVDLSKPSKLLFFSKSSSRSSTSSIVNAKKDLLLVFRDIKFQRINNYIIHNSHLF